MATSSLEAIATATTSAYADQSAPPQGSLESAGAGITGGYTGDSLPLKIIIAFLIGLALYNSIELIVLILVTFNKYHGLYFWSLVVAGFGVMPYSLGFLIKFFQLLDPSQNQGYVAVVLLTIGWWTMVTGQSVVLWSRLHLVTNSRRVLKYTLWMIIIDGFVFHSITTILTFGSNANSFSHRTLMRFVRGYTIMEKIQMVAFFIQELVISIIYIKETLRLLRLSESVKDDLGSIDDSNLKNRDMRKTMYQLIAINAIIIAMDIALLAVEFANLYLIETTLKGVVYSIKLKLEFAVLGKLVQLVRTKSNSGGAGSGNQSSGERRGTSTGLTMEKSESRSGNGSGNVNAINNNNGQHWPDFVDPTRVSCDVTHAEPQQSPQHLLDEVREGDRERDRYKRRSRAHRDSWIEEEMDKHNIG